MKVILLLLAGSGWAWAGDLRLTVHWVELPHERTTELLSAHPEGAALFGKVRELVKMKEARLIDTQLLQVKGGESGRAESVGELIYPTEYDPPDLPRSQGEEARERRMMEGWWRAVPTLPFVPVNFEVRNVGETLELSAGTEGHRFAAELLFNPRSTPITTVVTPDGNPQQVGWPEFESLRVTSQLVPGDWELATVLTPKDAAGEADTARKLLVFARLQSLDD
jgi:hypothetical protein